MTVSGQAFSVAGEGVPRIVPLSLALVGAACAFLAARGWQSEHDVSRDQAVPVSAFATPTASASSSVLAAASSSVSATSRTWAAPMNTTAGAAAPASTGAVGETKCEEIVVPFDRMALVPSAEGEARITRLAHWLANHEDARLTLDGHADSTGSEEGNLVLSRARANAVRGRLERAGIARERLTVRAFGAFWPEEGVPTDASANRRVVLRVRGKTCPTREEERVQP